MNRPIATVTATATATATRATSRTPIAAPADTRPRPLDPDAVAWCGHRWRSFVAAYDDHAAASRARLAPSILSALAIARDARWDGFLRALATAGVDTRAGAMGAAVAFYIEAGTGAVVPVTAGAAR